MRMGPPNAHAAVILRSRALARRLEGWPQAPSQSSFEARRRCSHLRMTDHPCREDETRFAHCAFQWQNYSQVKPRQPVKAVREEFHATFTGSARHCRTKATVMKDQKEAGRCHLN